MQSKSWFSTVFWLSMFLIFGIGVLNYIVDPFSVTQNNLLSIPVKLVSDDRTEKVIAINNMDNIDNILLGSSRVYLMNPLVLSRYAGGVTYNLGVGTAQAEDHLGLLLHLNKINKFPKVIILGLDFYSFNDALETNKYFIRNKTINFLNENSVNAQYIGEFVSWDTTRASVKTLKTFFGVKKEKQRFDVHGASGNASTLFEYFPVEDEGIDIYERDKQRKAIGFLTEPPFTNLSNKRFDYLKKIIELSEKNNSVLKIFVTPLYGELIDVIYADDLLKQRIIEFKKELSAITGYYDFLTHNEVTMTAAYFNDTSHLKTSTGNLILARIYDDKDVAIPGDFGVYRERSVSRH